jgi:excisionase family DNA binding protein
MDENRAKRLAALLTELVGMIVETESVEVPAPRQPSDHALLTVEEGAERLHIGRTRMYALVKSGAIESVQIGRLRRIPATAIDAYADRLRRR